MLNFLFILSPPLSCGGDPSPWGNSFIRVSLNSWNTVMSRARTSQNWTLQRSSSLRQTAMDLEMTRLTENNITVAGSQWQQPRWYSYKPEGPVILFFQMYKKFSLSHSRLGTFGIIGILLTLLWTSNWEINYKPWTFLCPSIPAWLTHYNCLIVHLRLLFAIYKMYMKDNEACASQRCGDFRCFFWGYKPFSVLAKSEHNFSWHCI